MSSTNNALLMNFLRCFRKMLIDPELAENSPHRRKERYSRAPMLTRNVQKKCRIKQHWKIQEDQYRSRPHVHQALMDVV